MIALPQQSSPHATIAIFAMLEILWIIWQCVDLIVSPIGIYFVILLHAVMGMSGIFLVILAWIVGVAWLGLSSVIIPSAFLTMRVVGFVKLPRQAQKVFLILKAIEITVSIIGVIITWSVVLIVGCDD